MPLLTMLDMSAAVGRVLVQLALLARPAKLEPRVLPERERANGEKGAR